MFHVTDNNEQQVVSKVENRRIGQDRQQVCRVTKMCYLELLKLISCIKNVEIDV